ncbi:hypothetical protein IWW55_002499 [Coemansia sp. RSA 2706]|nr:hypothetical protein IWW55_002499 [Coemansia sp. RSA 2706]KAJ2307839.1 hypothetical protein IWW54_004261 [Coemansia sp. RSA 2705]KAJ2315662.1 hypothetical protein IWW52_003997 [Coemansia sp. RSA 2704]KAJ2326141.1 hypothetical protein IWW51_002427 [Coemansia sp. RSA 2702]KAJ2727461.1 hypothetical protein H4R23_003882 [Coemansia sp. Cherry 401B]
MATVGLFRGPAVRSIAAALGSRSAPAINRSAQRLAMPAVLQIARSYVRTDNERLFIQEFGLLCKHIPEPWTVSALVPTADSFARIKSFAKERLLDVFSLLTLKYHLGGWKKAPFAADAEELYNYMNEAYAQGNGKYLETICTPNMVASLRNSLKSRKFDFDWRKESTLTPARIVQIRCGRIAGNYTVGQVVVRIDQEQTVTPIVKGARGGPVRRGVPKTTHVREYVVFQRAVTDSEEPWCIYGKIPVPSWDQPK